MSRDGTIEKGSKGDVTLVEEDGTLELVGRFLSGPACQRRRNAGLELPFDHEQGALDTAEFISLDTCLAIMNVLHEGLADPKYRPLLLVKFLEAKWLGLKVGKSFTTTIAPSPSLLA